MWDNKQYDLRPIVPGGQVSEIEYWPIPADPVNEADGGTYYRPEDATAEDDEWIAITAGPSLPGQFSFPGSTMSMENDTGGTISVYLMFRNAANQKCCDDVLIAQLIVGVPSTKLLVEAADGLDLLHVFTQADITNPGSIAKVRYRIEGPDGLYWDGGGNMGKLHV